jgi:hypothetical protein
MFQHKRKKLALEAWHGLFLPGPLGVLAKK